MVEGSVVRVIGVYYELMWGSVMVSGTVLLYRTLCVQNYGVPPHTCINRSISHEDYRAL